MSFAPQRHALFRHPNLRKWSEPLVFLTFWLRNVLRATTACTFSTLQLPKVVRQWCVLYILTWKCASRHNGVQFFISPLASCLCTRRFSEPTFRPSGATNHWKNTVNRDFPTFSRISIFFLLTLSLLLFSLLIFLFSLPLPCSAFHLSILSEVWLLNFLRSYVSLPSSRSVLMLLLHNFHKGFHGGFMFGKDVLRSLCSVLSWITLYNPSSYQRQQQLEVTEVTHLANMAHNVGIGIVSHIIYMSHHVTSCYIMLSCDKKIFEKLVLNVWPSLQLKFIKSPAHGIPRTPSTVRLNNALTWTCAHSQGHSWASHLRCNGLPKKNLAHLQGQLSWHLSASHQAILVSCISWKKFRRSTGSTGSTATLLVLLYYLLATAFRTSLTSKCMFAGNKEDVSRRHLSQYCKSIKWNWPSHLDLFICIAYLIVNWNILVPDPTAQS